MEVSKLVPEVYYKESRDFSYVGRIFEVLFNYIKTNADLVGVSPSKNDISNDILELAGITLGFESKHKYTKKDLVNVISDFVNLCSKKGTAEAIYEAIYLLLNSQNISADITNIELDADDSKLLNIYIPHQMTDITLLEDIFDYILPAGMTYRIYAVASTSTDDNKSLIVVHCETPVFKNASDNSLGQVSNDTNITDGEIPTNVNNSNFNLGVVVSDID